MLTRINGVAFHNQEELEAWEKEQQEARERDHRKICLLYTSAPEVRAQALTLTVAATPNAPDRLLSVRGIFLALHSP